MGEQELLPATDHSKLGYGSEDMPTEVAIAGSLIPYKRDDERARYLGYLACGFSLREALHLVSRNKPWLSNARHDPAFVELETRIPEIRKELAKEYVELEFFRNFRLALEKDYRVMWKALNPDKMQVTLTDGTVTTVEEPMSRQDHDYLLKIRSQYTPQQLQIIEAVVSSTGDGFNFSKWVAENSDLVKFSRTDTVEMRRGAHAEETDDS